MYAEVRAAGARLQGLFWFAYPAVEVSFAKATFFIVHNAPVTWLKSIVGRG